MGILDQAIREMALEKQAAEDAARQALEDFDIITMRAIAAVKKMVASLQTELQDAGWWAGPLQEEAHKPDYLSLSFAVRRHAGQPPQVSNPDYIYAIRFDAVGGAIRTATASEPLLEPMTFRAVARQDFSADLETDLKLFLKAILYRHPS